MADLGSGHMVDLDCEAMAGLDHGAVADHGAVEDLGHDAVADSGV